MYIICTYCRFVVLLFYVVRVFGSLLIYVTDYLFSNHFMKVFEPFIY